MEATGAADGMVVGEAATEDDVTATLEDPEAARTWAELDANVIIVVVDMVEEGIEVEVLLIDEDEDEDEDEVVLMAVEDELIAVDDELIVAEELMLVEEVLVEDGIELLEVIVEDDIELELIVEEEAIDEVLLDIELVDDDELMVLLVEEGAMLEVEDVLEVELVVEALEVELVVELEAEIVVELELDDDEEVLLDGVDEEVVLVGWGAVTVTVTMSVFLGTLAAMVELLSTAETIIDELLEVTDIIMEDELSVGAAAMLIAGGRGFICRNHEGQHVF